MTFRMMGISAPDYWRWLIPPCLLLICGCGGNTGYTKDQAVYEPILYVLDGDYQQAPAGAAFPKKLSAFVQDRTGHRYSEKLVRFTLPTSGPSATFDGGSMILTLVTDGNGVVETSFLTANSVSGNFEVTAGLGGSNPPQSQKFHLTIQ